MDAKSMMQTADLLRQYAEIAEGHRQYLAGLGWDDSACEAMAVMVHACLIENGQVEVETDRKSA